MIYKVIIAGSRDFDDYKLLCDEVDVFLSNKKHNSIVIVSGTAKGADALGERYATEHNYVIERHPADWDRYGKSAGYKRNEDMAYTADGCVAFWKNGSRGTMHMINIAKENGLDLRIVNV